MTKKTDCINYIPPIGKDCELCRIRNDWCVPCETCEQYESFISWFDQKHKNISPKEDLTMSVVDRKPVPIYEAECSECHSKIQYRKSEVSIYSRIICPVCGMPVWANTIRPVRYEGNEKC